MTQDELHAIRAELDWLDAHASGLIGSGTRWATQHLRAFLESPNFQPSRKARVTEPFLDATEVCERR